MSSNISPPPPLRLQLDHARIIPWLWAMMAALLALSVTGNIIRATTGHETALGLVPLFDVDREQSVPTFFSACLLLGASGLLALAAAGERARRAPFAKHWGGLAAGFLYLATDEVAGLHEQFGPFARFLIPEDFSASLHRCWVISGVIGVALVSGLYARFVWHLPAAARGEFLRAGLTYLGGAIGVEVFSTIYWEPHPTGWSHSALPTLEEGMEMAGVILFIGALLRHLAGAKLAVAIAQPASAPSLAPTGDAAPSASGSNGPSLPQLAACPR